MAWIPQAAAGAGERPWEEAEGEGQAEEDADPAEGEEPAREEGEAQVLVAAVLSNTPQSPRRRCPTPLPLPS